MATTKLPNIQFPFKPRLFDQNAAQTVQHNLEYMRDQLAVEDVGLGSIDGSTPTPLTGMLKGNGTDVDVATAGVDYLTPSSLSPYQLRSEEGAANGYASLDATGKVPLAQLPPTGAVGPAGGDLSGTYPNPTVVKSAGSFAVGNQITWAGDTNLYRGAAGVLQSDNRLSLVGGHYVGGGYTPQARNTLEMWLSSASLVTIGESASGDANPAITFYRTSAGGAAGVASRIWHPSSVRGLAFQHAAGTTYGAETYTTYLELDLSGKLLFGPEGSQDTNLYRSAAGQLKTDGHFFANGQLVVDYDNTGDKLWLSGAYDTNLYRVSAGILKTDGKLQASGDRALQSLMTTSTDWAWVTLTTGDTAVRAGIDGTGRIYWGPGGSTAVDTNLHRTGAGILRTDGTFDANQLTINGTPIFPINDSGLPARLASKSWGTAADLGNGNLNNALSAGWYWAPTTCANTPNAATHWYVEVITGDGASYLVQIAYAYDSAETWRRRNAGGWSSWTKIAPIDDTNLPPRLKSASYNSGAANIVDCNAATQSGWYSINNGTANYPPGANYPNYSNLYVSSSDSSSSGNIAQLLICYWTDEVWFRRCHSGTWQSWKKLSPIDDTNLPARISTLGPVITASDANQTINNGWYCTTPSCVNLPVADYGALEILNITYTGACRQIWYRHVGNCETWMRHQTSTGVWAAWVQTWPAPGTNYGPTNLSLTNEWVNIGGWNYATATRTGLVVILDGKIRKPSSSTSANELVCNVPAGFRPQSTVVGIGKTNGGFWEAQVGSDGNVFITAWSGNPASGDGAGWASFTGISYPAYN